MIANVSFTADTNIVIYALDPRDNLKHSVALRIIAALARRKAPLPLQCLSEAYAACARKAIISLPKVTLAVTETQATMRIIPADPSDLQLAMQWHQDENLQFFDALLLATAMRAGCLTFLSEDMQDGRSFGTITVRNPFCMPPAELDSLLAT